ncbi:hypothetical protein OHC33_000074 [Knufia fluminis]|uniref:Mitochondrial inner membrane protease subunit 2 n=1 Tax=Knufia fluminis TaxID=191047 RepID=A0AAN8I7I0_9EURO|nr:hypothetical protein OHC33_000074 [Knufia fluminis]
MPPASRGPVPRLYLHCRRTRLPPRRNASVATPTDHRRFGKKIRSELTKARNAQPPPSPSTPRPTPAPRSTPSTPGPAPTTPPPPTTGPTWRTRQTARINRFLMPSFLRTRPYLRRWIFSFLVTVPISGFILVHLPLEPRRVTGPSMHPTINPDCASPSDTDASYAPTWVLIQKYNLNTYRDTQRRINKGEKARGKYSRGQMIVYHTPHDPEKIALKRIVGLPGDTVVPLPGYPGDPTDPIVIPYNHLWVEGDVSDRKKSVDSNYFGPISQHLVKGRVIALWSPWWNILGMRSGIDPSYVWPARQQNRVKEDAVQEAQSDPNHVESVKPFERAQGQKTLEYLRAQPLAIEQRFLTEKTYRMQVVRMYQRGKQVAKNYHDEETRERARMILKELERVIGRDALRQAASPNPRVEKGLPKKRWEPAQEEVASDWEKEAAEEFVDVVAHQDEREAERKARLSPAKAALKEMLEKKREYGEMIDKEFEQRDKIREAREL